MVFHVDFHILHMSFHIPHVSLHILHVSLGIILHYIIHKRQNHIKIVAILEKTLIIQKIPHEREKEKSVA